MGNASSSSSTSSNGGNSIHSLSSSFALKKSNGSLGLSRTELDKRCKPSGLYSACPWDDKAIRKLIGDGKLASRVRGNDDRQKSNEVECPICFLYYNQVNVTECCSAFCCSECFLQLQPPDGKKANTSDTSSNTSSKGKCHKAAQAGCDCPFCNAPRVSVKISTSQANLNKIAEREEEEQKIIEAKIRASLESKKAETAHSSTPLTATFDSTEDEEAAEDAFGQSLRQMSLSQSATPMGGVLVASVEERKRIEDEMKQQHRHPLVRRMQEEAEEASNARAAAYERSVSDLQPNRRNRLAGRYGAGRAAGFLRSRSERDWSSLMEGAYGRDDFPSLDDLVVLEAAIMLSMEEEARLRENGGSDAADNDNHQASFPLLQALMSRNTNNNNQEESEESDNDGGLRLSRGLSRMSSSRRRRRRNRMLGGMTEEEQVAMAIALSLRESSASAENNNNPEGSTNNNRTSSQESSMVASASSEGDLSGNEDLIEAGEF